MEMPSKSKLNLSENHLKLFLGTAFSLNRHDGNHSWTFQVIASRWANENEEIFRMNDTRVITVGHVRYLPLDGQIKTKSFLG